MDSVPSGRKLPIVNRCDNLTNFFHFITISVEHHGGFHRTAGAYCRFDFFTIFDDTQSGDKHSNVHDTSCRIGRQIDQGCGDKVTFLKANSKNATKQLLICKVFQF